MVSISEVRRTAGTIISLAVLAISFWSTAQALAAEKVLHAFKGGSDGLAPQAGVIMDSAGNLYGTTAGGGGGTGCNDGNSGCGTVYEISGGGTETILYAFAGGGDGAFPFGGILSDGQGNLYGTTGGGGTSNIGTVFKVTPSGSETVLYSFQGGSDGWNPHGSLIADTNGNLFGETINGGSYNGSSCTVDGCGTVFELKPDGTKVTLYSFQGGSDGAFPNGGLIADKSGNLYGTAEEGGDLACGGIGGGAGCGVVFQVAPNGSESVLYAFQGGADGGQPRSALISDAAGNLYGTTIAGGNTQSCSAPDGCGVVFKLAPDGTETALYAFGGGSDGNLPFAGVIRDKSGNLYGTTYEGGSTACHGAGCGTVFKLAPDGTEAVLYVFGQKNKGRNPAAALLLKSGILYGTAVEGGANNGGVVFSVRK